MDYEEVGANIRASYRVVSSKYRNDDEIEVMTENHRHFSRMLKNLTRSFHHPISALDVGCGTGRYFHCLENVKLLLGIDISPDMLKLAEFPVRHSEITVRETRLLCRNIYLTPFPVASFNFIYS